MRLNKLFIVFILFIVFCGFGSAGFEYNGKQCTTSPNDYQYYNDSGSITATTFVDVDDITQATNQIFAFHVVNYISNETPSNDPAIMIDPDTGTQLYGTNFNSSACANNWGYRGVSHTCSGFPSFDNTDYNITIIADMTTNTGNFTWQPGGSQTNMGDGGSNDFQRLELQNAGGNLVEWDYMVVWNCTDNACNCPFVDITPPQNSSWNVTSGNVVGNTTVWNTKGLITISSNLLSLTVTANEDSNGSCVLDQNWNHTYTVANNSNYKFATTERTAHAYIVFDNISSGNHCLYCSFIDNAGNEYANSSSGCLNLTYTADTCSCPSTPSNWAVNMADDCVLNSACNITGYNLTFYNQGNFTVNQTLYIDNMINLSSGMTVWMKATGLMWYGAK